MNYKETLLKARELGIDIIALDVANEVEALFDIELTDDEFELCCERIEEAYLKSDDLSISKLTLALYNILTAEGTELNVSNAIKNTTRRLIINEACYL